MLSLLGSHYTFYDSSLGVHNEKVLKRKQNHIISTEMLNLLLQLGMHHVVIFQVCQITISSKEGIN